MTPAAPGATALQFFDGALRVFPRQRREPADAVGVVTLGLGKVVVGLARGLHAHRFAAPVDVGAGQRHHRHVDARLVHVLDAQLPVEVAFLRNHHRRVAAKYFWLPVGTNLQVVDAGLGLQQFQPRVGERVGVDINHGHVGKLLLSAVQPAVVEGVPGWIGARGSVGC